MTATEGDGLVPVVVQDVRNNNVLMLAYMNDESLELTRKTGYMHYWSRSRNAIWKKGETSGNLQKCIELMTDCDGDALLARVGQTGVACHTGARTCFGDVSVTAERHQEIIFLTAVPHSGHPASGFSSTRCRASKGLRQRGHAFLESLAWYS